MEHIDAVRLLIKLKANHIKNLLHVISNVLSSFFGDLQILHTFMEYFSFRITIVYWKLVKFMGSNVLPYEISCNETKGEKRKRNWISLTDWTAVNEQ